MNSTERSIRGRYLVLVGANLLASGFGFASASLIAWRFHAADFGAVALATSLAAYAVLLANIGSEIHAVRTVAAGKCEPGSMASSLLVVRLMLALLAYGLVVVLAYGLPQLADVRPLLLLFGLSAFTTACSVTWMSQALHRSNVFAIALLGVQALSFGGLLIGLEFVHDVRLVAVAKLIAEAVVAAAMLIWVIRSVGPLLRPFPPSELWALVRQCAPIGGTQLARGLALGSDLVILGFLVSKSELGHYAAAFKIFLGLTALSSAYFVILLPRVAAHGPDVAGMREEIRASLARVLPVFVGGAILLGVIAEPVLRLLFSPSFGAAAGSLRVLCLALLVSLAYRHYRQVLLARGRQAADLGTTTISGILHVGLKLVLVPVMGIMGAAVGTLLGELCLLACQRRLALREFETNA